MYEDTGLPSYAQTFDDRQRKPTDHMMIIQWFCFK